MPTITPSFAFNSAQQLSTAANRAMFLETFLNSANFMDGEVITKTRIELSNNQTSFGVKTVAANGITCRRSFFKNLYNWLIANIGTVTSFEMRLQFNTNYSNLGSNTINQTILIDSQAFIAWYTTGQEF